MSTLARSVIPSPRSALQPRSAPQRAQVPRAAQGPWQPAPNHRHRIYPGSTRRVRRRLLLARLPRHHALPRTNSERWQWKVDRNQHGTSRPMLRLEAAGWQVLRFWEHVRPRGGSRRGRQRPTGSAGAAAAPRPVRADRRPRRPRQLPRCAAGISSAWWITYWQNTKNATPTLTPLPICLYDSASPCVTPPASLVGPVGTRTTPAALAGAAVSRGVIRRRDPRIVVCVMATSAGA